MYVCTHVAEYIRIYVHTYTHNAFKLDRYVHTHIRIQYVRTPLHQLQYLHITLERSSVVDSLDIVRVVLGGMPSIDRHHV